MSGPVAIDVHGFGGGFTLGAVQAGWDLAAKFSRQVGFGVLNALANHDLLGPNWDSIASLPNEWEPMAADMIFGNPPCAAFSTFNTAKGSKGVDSSINDYMWELVRYAGSVGPPIVIFESVQQTYRQGLPLMRQLRDELESISGHQYELVHVLHNNASVGGVSIRRRYFWVATRIPFGVEPGVVRRDGSAIDRLTYVPSFDDMLRDLEPLGLTLAAQPYRGVTCACRPNARACQCAKHHRMRVLHSSEWCRREVHDGTGMVDGHDVEHSKAGGRVRALLLDDENPRGVVWAPGDGLEVVMRAYLAKNGDLPSEWRYESYKDVLNDDGSPVWEVDDVSGRRKRKRTVIRKDQRLIETDFALGPHQPHRWHGYRMARVITGGATHDVYHPRLNRPLTQREAARIQGFPDEWRIWPVRNAPDLGPAWGKGVPVQTARWVSYWARECLDNHVGADRGTPLTSGPIFKLHGGADRERVIDVTNHYRPFAEAIGDHG